MDAKTFRTIRRTLGLTQAQLSRILGYGAAVRISELERGTRPVTLHVAMLMQAFADGWRPAGWPGTPAEGEMPASEAPEAEEKPAEPRRWFDV